MDIPIKLDKSRYNLEIERFKNGDILMFNSLTTSLILLDVCSREIYYNVENLDINEIKDESTLKIIETLTLHGFFIEQGLDEYKYYEILLLKSKYSDKSLNLTIAVTMDCNMSCPYCFEIKEDTYMNKDTAEQVLKFIKKYNSISGINQLNINWFGGEPLLNLDIIEYLSEKLIEYCSQNNIIYMAGITTNGVLLNKDIALKLKDYNIKQAEVTIDGPKEIHNKRRVLKNKNGSYDIIFNNINQCKNILSIRIRTNIDYENMNNVHELFNEFNKQNFEFYYEPVINCNMDIESSGKFLSNEQFSKIDIALTEYIHKNLKNNINEIFPRLRSNACSGSKENSYIIDPNGLLHKCNAFLSEPSESIGNIFEGITSHSNNLKWIGSNIPVECKQCNKLPICGTGCPLESIKNPNLNVNCPYRSFDLKERIQLFLDNK